MNCFILAKHLKAKAKIPLLQLLKCEDLVPFFILCDGKLDIFGF